MTYSKKEAYARGAMTALGVYGLSEKYAAMSPNQQTALALIGGAGAGTAAAYEANQYNNKDKKKKDKEDLGLIAAGAGAGMGAAGGALTNTIFFTEPIDPANNPYRKAMNPSEYDALERSFRDYTHKLESDGVFAETMHKRILVPKKHISEKGLKAMGYQPVLIAIPEPGQDRLTSYRHPTDNYHLHSHGDVWTMHRDAHPAASMLVTREKRPLSRAAALLRGIPHILTEGLPGLAIYGSQLINNLLGRKGSMVDAIRREQTRLKLPMFKEAAARKKKNRDSANASEDSEESNYGWIAPAAALAGGLGTYAYLRKPSYSNVPEMRAMQQQAARKGFHRIVDQTHTENRAQLPGLWGKIEKALRPRMNEDGVLDWKNRILLSLREGSGAIPVGSENGKQWIALPGHGKAKAGEPINVKGYTAARHDVAVAGPADAPMAQLIQGGHDAEGAEAVQNALTQLGAVKGKGFEADLLTRYAPEAIPESLTDLSAFHQQALGRRRMPSSVSARVAAARRAQAAFARHMGEDDFVMKPLKTVQSRGKFPWGKSTDWGKELEAYENKLRTDPEFRKAVKDAYGHESITPLLREAGVLPGYTVKRFLEDPSSVFVQRAIPNPDPTGEWRVHAMRGAAPTSLMLPRDYTAVTNPAHWKSVANFPREKMREFVESTLAKFPPEYRDGSYGMDVMAYKKPDGTLGFKIVELNPYERFTPGVSTGGSSGLMSSYYNPAMGQLHVRNATGRWDPTVAGIGALGVGGLAGAAGYGASRNLSNDDEVDGK